MRYHNITKDDMLNGVGLRVVLWVAGCAHCCKECHNPITWDPNGGLEFDESAKQEIFRELEKDYIHGITFSGGDPLHINNAYDVAEFAKEIRKRYPNKSIWLYTGSTWDEAKHMRVIPYLDVLCDGEFEVDKKDENTHWVGSTNQRVIDVRRTLREGKVILYED